MRKPETGNASGQLAGPRLRTSSTRTACPSRGRWSCGIGSWGGQRPNLADSVRGSAAMGEATAAGGGSCWLRSPGVGSYLPSPGSRDSLSTDNFYAGGLPMKHILACVLLVIASVDTAMASDIASAPAPNAQKAVLVTGASTGIGRKITERLARDGYFVYAGARKEQDL